MLTQNKSPILLLSLALACIFTCPLHARAEEMPSKKMLTLEECIQSARENNPKLVVYLSRVKQKEEAYSIAEVADRADLNLSASYNRLAYISQMKQRFIGNSLDDYQARLWLKQPLYTGGRTDAARKESLYSLNSAKKAYEQARNEVVYGVKTAYYRLLFAGEAVDVKKDLLGRLQSYLSVARELNRRTKLPREETLLRIKAQVSNAQQEYVSARKNKAIAGNMLMNAMGVSGNAEIEIADIEITEEDNSYRTRDFDLASNPELMRLDEEIKRAESLVSVAGSARYPQVSLQLSYGYEWAKLLPEQDDWAAGVTLDMPLWDWNRTKARINQAKAYAGEAGDSRALMEKQLSYEVESAYLNYRSNMERIIMAREGLQAAQKSLSLFEKRYADATATSFELLDAEQSYLQARLNYIQAVLDMRLAGAEMEKITGKPYEYK